MLGLLAGASNATFAVEVTAADDSTLAVYKPRDGERPLWDFPAGTLHLREVAAYRLAQALGWDLVPETVVRADAPLGEGSLQRFVDHDPNETAFTLFDARPDDFRRIVLLDAIANNADRKGGHVLHERETGRLWCIDNGLSFHVEEKLRTVLWPFGGEPIAPELLAPIATLADDASLPARFTGLLAADEVEALCARAGALVAAATYPKEPEDRYGIPWPPV